MFKLEVRTRKAQCWQSRWRGVGHNGDGHPTHYIPLTQDEMMQAAALGHVQVPESAIPSVVRRRQEKLDQMAAEAGYTFDQLPEITRDLFAIEAMREVPA